MEDENEKLVISYELNDERFVKTLTTNNVEFLPHLGIFYYQIEFGTFRIENSSVIALNRNFCLPNDFWLGPNVANIVHLCKGQDDLYDTWVPYLIC